MKKCKCAIKTDDDKEYLVYPNEEGTLFVKIDKNIFYANDIEEAEEIVKCKCSKKNLKKL